MALTKIKGNKMLSRRIKSIGFIGLMLLFSVPSLVAFSDTGEKIPDDLRKFIYDQYLKADKRYGAVAVNRFRSAGAVRCTGLIQAHDNDEIFLSRESFEDGIFDVYLTNGPEKQKIVLKKTDPQKDVRQAFGYNLDELFKRIQIPNKLRKCLYLTEICETRNGSFIFYCLSHLFRLSSSVTMDIIYNEPRAYVQGFLIKRGQTFIVPEFHIETLDTETKSYYRTFWDIFSFQGKLLVLIFRGEYETYIFEIYSLDRNEVKLQYSFPFGGL